MNADKLIADLKRDEGWRASAYRDSRGYLTIGYGFLIDPEKGGEMPVAVGDFWLRIASQARWDDLKERIPWVDSLPERAQRGLANMAYQIGPAGVMKFQKMLASLKRHSYDEAAAEALDSAWARQTPTRAHRVASMLRNTL